METLNNKDTGDKLIMGLIVQHDEIVELLKKKNMYHGDELIVYVTLKSVKPLYVKMNYLNLDNYIVQGAWLAISTADLKVISVNQLGKLQEDITVIPFEEIGSFTIKKNILLYTISIKDLQDNLVEFKISSKILGNKNHHIDFLKLLAKKI